LLREPLEVRQLQRESLLHRQRAQCGPYRLTLFRHHASKTRVCTSIVGEKILLHHSGRLEAKAAALPPALVDGPVPSDTDQPCDEGTAARVELACPLPKPEERLLHNIFGHVRIVKRPQRNRVDQPTVSV